MAIEMAIEESAQSDPDRTVTMEMEYYHRNGSIVWMENIVSAIRNDDGQLIGLQGVARDITDRKRADEIVQTSEKKFSKAFHSSPILTAISTMEDGRFLDVNEIFVQTLLFSREEIIGKTSLELGFFASPAQRQAIRTITEEKGYAKNIETQMVTKNGQIIEGLFSAEPITIDNKKCWLTVMVDVTEQKGAEEKLRESELKYRSLFETSTQGILLYDRDGIIQMVNPSLINLLGAKFTEEIVGRPYLDFVHPDDREISAARVKNILHDAFETSSKINIGQVALPIREHRIIKTNGDVVYVESTGVALQYHGSTHIQGIFRDISERKRAEDALRESETKYRNLFDQATDGIMIMPVDGSYITVNESFAKLHGYDSPKELEYINLSDLDTPETAKLAPERMQRIFAGEAMKFEVEHYHKNGHILSLDVACNIINIEDKSYYIGFHKDITEHKQAEKRNRDLEERLQRSEKMEALGILAGGVAHDLNNVLGIVVGYAEMLMDEMDEANPMRNDMKKILEGGNRSAAIVQDLLTLARRGVQTKKTVNLNATIADCQKLPEFEKVFSYNPHVELKMDLETDLLNIMGSPVHLGKTIINLVSNSVDAMPNGGLLKITTTNQYLDAPIQGYDNIREGDYVVLSVFDTGEGILERDIKRIFEPFYTKKVMGRSGTGLGLAVVWGTIKDHNGYINVESTEGKGTTFTLYFPVTRDEIAKVDNAIPVSEYIGKEESILVIDDIKEQRELAAKMLGKLNYKVKTVASGEEAVEYLRIEKAELLVLDMIMDPGMDGLDTYKAVLETHPGQKAIIVSGFSETEHVKEAKSLGAGDYLRKPYIQEKLGLAVRKELDRK
ncbi:MAG: PAS domain S-box protein [Syntrophus sp. (in: bacteria)]